MLGRGCSTFFSPKYLPSWRVGALRACLSYGNAGATESPSARHSCNQYWTYMTISLKTQFIRTTAKKLTVVMTIHLAYHVVHRERFNRDCQSLVTRSKIMMELGNADLVFPVFVKTALGRLRPFSLVALGHEVHTVNVL